MDYQELDEIRFDEIYEYDNSELDEDQETEYYDNQYYFGLATQDDECMPNNNYWLFASTININTFYQFPFDDVQTYLNNYRVIGPQNKMLVPEIMKMKFVDSEYNCPIYTIIKKTFWLKLIQRTWKKIYKKKKDMIQKNMIYLLRKREMGEKISLPGIQGMLYYLKVDK